MGRMGINPPILHIPPQSWTTCRDAIYRVRKVKKKSGVAISDEFLLKWFIIGVSFRLEAKVTNNNVKRSIKMTEEKKTKKKGFFSFAKIAGIIAIISLVVVGIQSIQKTLSNPEPETVTFQDYFAGNSEKAWVSMTDCRLNILKSAYTTKLTRMFIPVYNDKDKNDKVVRLVMETKDAKYLDMVREIKELKGKNDTKGAIKALLKMREAEKQVTIKGMVLAKLDENSSDKDQIKKMIDNLAPQFRIIRHNEKPAPIISGIFILMLATGFLGLLVRSYLKHKNIKVT